MSTGDGGELAGLGTTIGVEGFSFDGEVATARLPVRPQVLQPFGIVHGGAYSSLAETVTSRATYEVVAEEGMGAFGQSISTSFLRPVEDGNIHCSARAVHRGRTTWVWEVQMRDDHERLCAIATMTVAVRPLHPGV